MSSKMFKFVSYTFLTVMTADLLATSGDITMTWTSPMFPKLKSNDSDINPFDLPITEEEDSWIGSLINVGAIIGPFPYGIIATRFGRKIGLLCVAVPHIISYLTLAFSKSVHCYYFARLLGGIAVGGGYTLLPMYVAEIAEDSNRGMLSATLGIFWSIGNLIPYIIGPFLPIVWFNVILACVPTFFFILFAIIGPESPHYLIGKNKIDEAKKSLMILRSNNKKAVEVEIQDIRNGLEKEEKESHFFDLFKSRVYIKGLVICLVLIMANQLCGINAVLFYLEDIFISAGVKNISSENSSIIIGFVILFSSFGTPVIVDRLGKRFLLLISNFGVTVSLLAFSIYFYIKEYTDISVDSISWLPLLSLIFFIVTYNSGIGPLSWTFSSELFPTSVKSHAASLVSCTCWTSSFLVTRFFNDLNDSLGKTGTVWLFAGFSFSAWVFTLLYVPETKGKSFYEIQILLKKVKAR